MSVTVALYAVSVAFKQQTQGLQTQPFQKQQTTTTTTLQTTQSTTQENQATEITKSDTNIESDTKKQQKEKEAEKAKEQEKPTTPTFEPISRLPYIPEVFPELSELPDPTFTIPTHLVRQ